MPDSAAYEEKEAPASHWSRYGLYILGAALIIASILIRVRLFPIVSIDYTASLSNWMAALNDNPGLSAFKYPFSNYAPLYLYFLKFLTLLPFSYLFSIKALTTLFDIALAIVAMLIIREKRPSLAANKPLLFVAGAVVFSIPTVILNGAAWAQVDAAYTAFVLLSLYFILKDRPLWAAIAFGIAFSFKLQAIFFLPVLAGYLLSRIRLNIKEAWYAAVIPAIFILTVMPAWLGGGPFGTWLTRYAAQSQESPLLTRSAPSIFSFMDKNDLDPANHPVAPKAGIAAAFASSVAIMLAVAYFNRAPYRRELALVALSLICALAVPFFLPYMHERYFYMADILAVILVFYRPYLICIPVAVIIASFYSYMPFLSATVPQASMLIVERQQYLGALMLFALLHATAWFAWWRYRIYRTQQRLEAELHARPA